MPSIGVDSRTSAFIDAISLRTYSREPPLTACHCGRLSMFKKPWRSKNSTKKRAGNDSIASASADQMARPIGRM